MIPGELQIQDGDIEFNVGRPTRSIEVGNTSDRPVQVGSHYHFYETNPALTFDREQTKGWRLNIAAGTAVRFEPGQTRTVELVPIGGGHNIYGFRGEVMGHVDMTAVLSSATGAQGADKGPVKGEQSAAKGGQS